MWCFFFLFFWVWKGLKTLTIVKVDYEQSLFYLSPPSETRKTRKWPRACRFPRLFTASPLDAYARTPLTKSEKKRETSRRISSKVNHWRLDIPVFITPVESFTFTWEKSGQKVHGKGENDGWILLSWDGSQRLQVSQLKGRRRLWNNVSGFFQGTRCIHFSLSSNDL